MIITYLFTQLLSWDVRCHLLRRTVLLLIRSVMHVRHCYF